MTQDCKRAFPIACVLLLSVASQPVAGVTFDYTTTANALVEMCYYDAFVGYFCMHDFDHNQDTNAPSDASASYEIELAGKASISSGVDVSTEPNKLILSTELAGSYELDAGWSLLEYFYQDANSTLEGWLEVTEFPEGTPCCLWIDTTFPTANWTAFGGWELYLESSVDYFVVGQDNLGPFGALLPPLTVYAGEPVYASLINVGWGFADHQYGDNLAHGKLEIAVALKAGPHFADLNADGRVDFLDFALFSTQWKCEHSEGTDQDLCHRADINEDGCVDNKDLWFFCFYCPLPPKPDEPRPALGGAAGALSCLKAIHHSELLVGGHVRVPFASRAKITGAALR